MALFTTLNGIIGAPISNIWLIGADGILGKRSVDNGSSWSDITSGTIDRSPFYGLPSGVFMGQGFTPAGVYRSTDNGDTFTHISNPTGVQINSITGNGAGKWALTGSSGTFAHSSDSGASWAASADPFSSSNPRMASVTNDKASTFIAVGDNHNPGAGAVGAIAVSTNSGVTWTDESIDISSEEFFDISTDGTSWIAVGTTTTIFKSTDDGSSWSDISSGVPFGGLAGDNINSICNFNGTWIIAGRDGTVGSGVDLAISISTDSGATWSAFVTNPGVALNSSPKIRVAADGTFMVVYGKSGGGKSIISNDFGLTWGSEVDTNINASFSAFITHLGNNSGNT